MSRLEKSVKNIAYSFGNTLLHSLLSFVSRTVFIITLGEEYLGLAGLLRNVLGVLSITEVGLSAAIGYSLYKPLAKKDYSTVSALMSLYRRAYQIIGTIVLCLGVILFFSLDFFIPPEQQPNGTTFAYFAFLIHSVAGYFLSYKTTLITSDNRGYQLLPIGAVCSTITIGVQIIILYLSHDYVQYLAVHIMGSVITMCIQNAYITRKYPDVNFKSRQVLPQEEKNALKRNVGGLVIQKIGDYLVNSTDNLIITKLISLSATGIYSNYLMIRNLINGIIATFFAGITASMGNIVAIESDSEKLRKFETMFFFAFFIYSFEASCFMGLFNLFIGDIWIGRKYIFDTSVVAVIVVNNYLTGLRIPLITMKGVAGKYMEDAWIPFAFAGINLVASIILAKQLGVAGVFLGTIIGSLCTADWYRPIIIYGKVFHVSVMHYYRKYLKYVGLGFAYMWSSFKVCDLIHVNNSYVRFLLCGVVSAIIPIIGTTVLFFNSYEFQSLLTYGRRIIKGLTVKNTKKNDVV